MLAGRTTADASEGQPIASRRVRLVDRTTLRRATLAALPGRICVQAHNRVRLVLSALAPEGLRRKSSAGASRARTRSRIASRVASGTHTAVSSPARCSRAGVIAFRRLVVPRFKPGARPVPGQAVLRLDRQTGHVPTAKKRSCHARDNAASVENQDLVGVGQ
jgi:hypothetical protein